MYLTILQAVGHIVHGENYVWLWSAGRTKGLLYATLWILSWGDLRLEVCDDERSCKKFGEIDYYNWAVTSEATFAKSSKI